MYIKIIITIAVFITFTGNTQTINPNMKHDWENNRYTVNDNDTVLDKKTGLIWKKCVQGLSDSACATGTVTSHTWQEALDLAQNSVFAGFSDWRLPNIKELRSLAAYDRYNLAINSDVFPNTPAYYFWSSSPYINHTNYSWLLNFNSGHDGYNYRSSRIYVRLVRGGQ